MAEWAKGNVGANGITIHYYRTGGDNKPPILLLHGITDSGLCWSRVAHALEGSYIECPILLITGDPDLQAIVTPEVAQEAAQLWKHGKVVHISGAGHNIHRDRYDETMAEVQAFLNSI